MNITKKTKKIPKNTQTNTKNREKKENEYHESYVNVCKRLLKYANITNYVRDT